MKTVKFRIHFKSGLSIDIKKETEFETYEEVFEEILNFAKGKPLGSKNFWCDKGKKKFYMFLINDIVCFEPLLKGE